MKRVAKTQKINNISTLYFFTIANMAKVQLTSGELAAINIAVQSTPDKHPRQYAIADLQKALNLQNFLVEATEERHDPEGNTLVDGNKMPLKFFKNEAEIDLTIEDKLFVKRLIEEQKWSLDLANEVQTLLEKLK